MREKDPKLQDKYRYTQRCRNNAESIEFDIFCNGIYETACVVNVRLLLSGIRTFSCGNGDDFKLRDSAMMEVLDFLKTNRDAIKYNDSQKVKTLVSWSGSGLNLDEFLYVGCEVDEALVDEQLNCVPPRSHKLGYVQVGEPYTDALDTRNGKERYRPVYATFHKKTKDGRTFWIYAGHCFAGDDVNRVPEKDLPGSMLRKLKEVTQGMDSREFYDYILENFNLDGTALRLVLNIIEYVKAQEFVNAEDAQCHLKSLLSGAFGIEEREIKLYRAPQCEGANVG